MSNWLRIPIKMILTQKKQGIVNRWVILAICCVCQHHWRALACEGSFSTQQQLDSFSIWHYGANKD